MTYCVALRVDAGIVMLADTRTNAGVDNISRFRKLFTYEVPGDRAFGILASGNLSITQGVKTVLSRAIRQRMEDGVTESILSCESMFRVAQLIGDAMSAEQMKYRNVIEMQGAGADATLMLAGQRKGGKPRLYLIYSAGNFIEATADTPYFQIGEHKYGKPILDRVISPDSSIEECVKAVCVSMDSTLRSNLSVGMPLDLAIIESNQFCFRTRHRIEADDERFALISQSWASALRAGFEDLPSFMDAPEDVPLPFPVR